MKFEDLKVQTFYSKILNQSSSGLYSYIKTVQTISVMLQSPDDEGVQS